jgi:hypothetical protein
MDCLRMSIRVKDKFDALAALANQVSKSISILFSFVHSSLFAAPSKRWRLTAEVDVSARHLNEAKDDVRLH